MAATKRYITITGPTGVGKSTLTRLVAGSWGWQKLEEEFSDNPYWAKFYGDRSRWALQSQVWFMVNKVELTLRVPGLRAQGAVVQDMPLSGDRMYVEILRQRGEMTEDDYQTYLRLYGLMGRLLPSADLIVYLRVSPQKLVGRIKARGRKEEIRTPLSYWRAQIKYFEGWVRRTKHQVLTIETDGLDFANGDRGAEQKVLALIENGLGKYG